MSLSFISSLNLESHVKFLDLDFLTYKKDDAVLPTLHTESL